MVGKTKKKSVKKAKVKNNKEEVEEEGGMDLDDAFSDSDDVEYGETKIKKKKKSFDDEMEDELEKVEGQVKEMESKVNGDTINSNISIKASKPISKVKKGDKIRVDGKEYTVDSHYVLIDHGSTKEMAVELFDSNDKDYQLRYFDDQVESTLEFYELQEIMYIKKFVSKVEW